VGFFQVRRSAPPLLRLGRRNAPEVHRSVPIFLSIGVLLYSQTPLFFSLGCDGRRREHCRGIRRRRERFLWCGLGCGREGTRGRGHREGRAAPARHREFARKVRYFRTLLSAESPIAILRTVLILFLLPPVLVVFQNTVPKAFQTMPQRFLAHGRKVSRPRGPLRAMPQILRDP